MAGLRRDNAPGILTPIPYPSPTSLVSSLPDSPAVRRPYHFATQCATVDNPNQKDQYGSSSVPIYQTATFKGMGGQYDYTRSGNPTRSHLGTMASMAKHAISPFRHFRPHTLTVPPPQNTISQKYTLLNMPSLYLREWQPST